MVFKDKLKLVKLPVSRVLPNPAQPRVDFNDKELQSLAESIRENEGLLDAVRRLLSREGPALLECRISPEETCVPGR